MNALASDSEFQSLHASLEPRAPTAARRAIDDSPPSTRAATAGWRQRADVVNTDVSISEAPTERGTLHSYEALFSQSRIAADRSMSDSIGRVGSNDAAHAIVSSLLTRPCEPQTRLVLRLMESGGHPKNNSQGS